MLFYIELSYIADFSLIYCNMYFWSEWLTFILEFCNVCLMFIEKDKLLIDWLKLVSP